MPESLHRLPYRAPFAWAPMREFFAARAIDGVETVGGETYRRLQRCGERAVALEVGHDAAAGALWVTLDTAETGLTADCLAAVERVFDLATDPAPIETALRRDPLLARCVAACPGLRPPGAWDGFELAIRAVLGQQITVTAARRLAARLVALCGRRVAATDCGLTHLFPTPADLARADLSALGMPNSRRRTLQAVAQAVLAEPDLLRCTARLDESLARWQAIPGVGDWTAHYIALRAFRAPDAFPASDLGLLRAAADGGARPTPQALRVRAEAWRPWRAYAAQHLWSAGPAGGIPT